MAEKEEEKFTYEEIASMVKNVNEDVREIKGTLEKLKEDIKAIKDTREILDQILYSIRKFEDKIEEIHNAVESYFKKKEEAVAPTPVPISEPAGPAKPVEETSAEVEKPARIPIPASVITGIFNEFFMSLKPTSTPHDVINALSNLKDKLSMKIGEDLPIFMDIERWIRRVRAFVAEGRMPEDELAELKTKAEEWRNSIH